MFADLVLTAMLMLITPTIPPAADTLVIRDVSVLPMTDSTILTHRTVVIAGSRILLIEPAAAVRIPAAAEVVDGRGLFLLPGLADMHVHLDGPESFPQFLQSGVLTVRDLNGSAATLGWRSDVAAGRLVGPRLIVSGPMIAGAGIPWSNKVVPKTAAEAGAAVEAQHAAGYDLIKIYDGISREVFEAAIAAARRLDMRSTGHIPADVGFGGVLSSGMEGLEHLDKTVFSVLGHDLDTLKIPMIVDSVRHSGMWVTPTLESMIQLARIGSGRYDSLMARPEALAAPASLREFWASVSSRLKGDRQPQPGVRYSRWTDYQMRLAGALARAGVPLLAGTDLPNAVLVPGRSLLGELDALVEAGLTRFQALMAATSAPARFMRQSADWGTVSPGQRADLLLVRANPLLGFETLQAPAGIVLRGRWYDAAALSTLTALPH